MTKAGRREAERERTGFQEGGPYDPAYDLRADFVMVYGLHGDLDERISAWKRKGYVVHLMTGVSWGGYQDYLNGKIDGREHWDEAQTDRQGARIVHGTSADIPYMVPTIAYADFLTERVRPAVDAGVEAIHLEEPEFWAAGGYSEAFRREWEVYYREPWQAPHTSADAQYRASKLKAYLYARTLDRICGALKEYARVRYGRRIRFYVPTHSLINYAQWRIVSPESKLLDLPGIDGYIAQVWTGTAQTPNVYNGVRKERTFETAFLEYGIMQELVRGTDRRMWFLHDPIADDPKHTWRDYRRNYIRTLVASLLHPGVSRYEICPWPRRIYTGEYPKSDGSGRERIPARYATELQVIANALGRMDGLDVQWAENGPEIGLLLADSAMYQRQYPHWSEEASALKYDGTEVAAELSEEQQTILDWSAFYGLALPLLKHGAIVRPVQLDNAGRFPGYLDDYRVLVLSYEFMKPESPGLHQALAQWVRQGGALVYVGDGSDEFHGVREWWNGGEGGGGSEAAREDDAGRGGQEGEAEGGAGSGESRWVPLGKRSWASPAEHLFAELGLGASPEPGVHPVGRGFAAYLDVHPAECAQRPQAAERLRAIVRAAIAAAGGPEWNRSSRLALRRGPYLIAAAMDESEAGSGEEQHAETAAIEAAAGGKEFAFSGKFVDLLDADLPILKQATLREGEQMLLYDLDRANADDSAKASGRLGLPAVRLIAAASRIDEIRTDEAGFVCTAEGPSNVVGAARFLLNASPKRVSVLRSEKNDPSRTWQDADWEWDAFSSTLLIRYVNDAAGIEMKVEF
ncbi:hypothetical protein CDO73_12085 [Saccharibacillus sp. O23]|uniref:hypothetical protein n=1 Tax=Saccharibacillus sp. O23 TaxID=2009338 RepID=UPI000B4DFAE6|nr:hypothetical protein [Saccharibacillus sp. O23]OWR29823.1 hypothetical protein CDO73_12085 [Saccharibacillus sp. O23]